MSPPPFSFTSNLPWFIRDPAVALVGKKCYHSLVERLDLSDSECIKYSISKALGIAIVVGGSIVKVPQILLVVSSGSARGLSLPAFALETLAYAITLAYSFRNGFPFSTYGENLFLTLQNVVILLLIVHYLPPNSKILTTPPQKANNTTGVVLTAAAAAGVAFALRTVAPAQLALLQMATLPLALFSKLPQIAQNRRAQSTGQLSAVAVFAQVLGCAARIFTTATEVRDPVVLLGSALALALNLVLAAQMWLYWGDARNAPVAEDATVKEKLAPRDFGWASGVQVHPEPPVLAGQPAQASPASGRRWARKVD